MLSRRSFLEGLVCTSAGAVTPALANPAFGNGGSRALRLHNVWSKQTVTFMLGRNELVTGAIHKQFNYMLRDHHNGMVGKMDPRLLTTLMDIQDLLDLEDPTFYVLSAYRSKQTQRMLRGRGEKVATHSMHLRGRAIDIRVPEVKMRELRDAAADLRMGGVGFYKRFVHLDTGSVRRW